MRNLSLMVLMFLLVGCNFARQSEVVQLLPTPTTLRVAQVTAVPTINREPRTVPVAQAAEPTLDVTPLPADSVSPCADPADLPRTHHTVSARLDYREQRITVLQRIAVVNRGDSALADIVLDVEPNRLPGAFMLESILLNDTTAPEAYELTGRRLSVLLPDPLPPACPLALTLNFTLRIPQIAAGINGYIGYFGFGSRQINLAHWLPMIAARAGDTWLINDAPVTVGEQSVADPADWDVTITVDGASDQLVMAAPGRVVQTQPGTWQIMHTNSRDFSLSMSERFKVMSQLTEDGVTVELYHFDDTLVQTAAGPVDAAAHALEAAALSLSMYSDLFGAYPQDRFVVVQGDFPDGMEFSDLVFVSSDWFRTYEGRPTSYLTIITVHEVAHQWWYARVGSNQALAPWMDEALATYSEYIFYEEFYPELKDWWWNTRVNTFIPQGFADRAVDSTVYEFTSVRQYINAVYLRGARMLHDLRTDMGTDAFFDWLRRYAEEGDGQMVTSDFLWSLLSPAQLDSTRETRELYLGQVEFTPVPFE